MTSNFKNKRFLITQGSLRNFGGAEVTTFELANYLQSQGAKVVIFTAFFHDPIKQIFDKNKIRVIKDRDAKLNLVDFDYIWVHHQLMPKSIIEQLGKTLPADMPKFIFHHMSSHDFLTIERPFIWELESRLSSLTLFNSPETRDKLMKDCFLGVDLNKINVFPNPAPLEYSLINRDGRDVIENVLIVSNHPPHEVTEAKQELIRRGYNVVSLGEGQDVINMIDARFLKSFDAVITIGKTVQYCLVAGIPVYVYDHFGGPGYLNSQNIARCKELNFSGRGFSEKDANTIVDEIILGFNDTLGFQQSNRKKLIKEFSIDNVVHEVLNEADGQKVEKFNEPYKNYVIMAQNMAFDYDFGINERAVIFNNELQTCKQQIEAKRLENVHLSDQLTEARQRLNSRSYKLARAISKPLRLVRNAVKKS